MATIITLRSRLLAEPVSDHAAMTFAPPPGSFSVSIERGIRASMRDGTRLSLDLYSPIGTTDQLPVILIRTPYGKHNFDGNTVPNASFFASHGFVVAIQDKRGKFESEGDYQYCAFDGEDGWDTAEWLVQQPFSNGRIGMYGSSYLGDTQLSLGRLRHPAVRCLIPHAASMLGSLGNRYTMGDTRAGGVLYLATYVRWFYERGARRHMLKLPPLDLDAACNILPLIDLFESIDGPPCDWQNVLVHDTDDEWWAAAHLLTSSDQFDVPSLHVNSWFDVGLDDTLVLFEHMRETSISELARRHQYLIVSPATHCGSELFTGNDKVGDVPVADARLAYHRLYLEWFNRWLRDGDAIDDWPRVRYFLLGRNEWRSSNTWPPEGAQLREWFLDSDGDAAGHLGGQGRLLEAHALTDVSDEYMANPHDPVPTVGGVQPSAYLKIAPLDQRSIEGRPDVLIYSSDPVGTTGITLAGPIRLQLWIEATSLDLDLVARFLIVTPDGRSIDLRDGVMRCRYRESRLAPELLSPGETIRVEINLHATAVWLSPGERLRIHIASSSFPRYERNLQTGGANYNESIGTVAVVKVWHGPNYPSRLSVYEMPPTAGARIV